LFADNYKVLKSDLPWNYSTSIKLGALLYSMEGRNADSQAVKSCKSMIKERTGIFSQFKDTTCFMTSVILSLKENPEEILERALDIYDIMKEQGFHSSPYLVLAALSIALRADKYDYRTLIIKAKNYYDAMKREHRFITSSDDYGYAAMLAMSDKLIDQAVREMENCYRLLKEEFSHSNAIQSLSHVLTFSDEEPVVKCSRVAELQRTLADKGCRFGSGMELSFLGLVSLLGGDLDQIAGEIAQANEYLKKKKGFGYWSISSKERIMYAAALVSEDYLADAGKGTMELTLANNITGILLAQQMAMIAASSGAAAAAASAN
jgi:hypothetical protein